MVSPPSCAECEASFATLLCEDEGLFFCATCSQSLHAKRARAHHVLKPLRICDQCEIAVALFACAHCGGLGDPLSFCFPCSSSLHSKKARALHKLEPIPFAHPFASADGASHPHEALHSCRFPFAESRVNTSEVDIKDPLPRFGRKDAGVLVLDRDPESSPAHPKAGRDAGAPALKRKSKRPHVSLEVCKEETNRSPVDNREPKSRITNLQSHDDNENQRPPAKRSNGRRPIQRQCSVSSDDTSRSSEDYASEDDETYVIKKNRKGSLTLETHLPLKSCKEETNRSPAANREPKSRITSLQSHGDRNNQGPAAKKSNGRRSIKRQCSVSSDNTRSSSKDNTSEDDKTYVTKKFREGSVTLEPHAPLKSCKEETSRSPAANREPKSRSTNLQSHGDKENRDPAAKRSNGRRPVQRQCSVSIDDTSSSREDDMSEDDETYRTKKYRKGSVMLEPHMPSKSCKEEKNRNPTANRETKSRITNLQSHDDKENQGPAAKRSNGRRPSQRQCTVSSDDTSSGSEDDTSEDDETYGTKKYRKGSVTLEAFVVDVHDHEDGHAGRGAHLELSEEQPEGGVQARIRKMLELGLHPDTPDIEAQQALKNAQRLLTKYNLQQADVLKGGLEVSKHVFKAGMRMVELRSKDKLKPGGRFEHWVYSLAHIVSKYFDTQYFVQKRLVLKVVFYGIKQNVDCAGYAFAATFNRISKLSADYRPPKQANNGKASQACSSRSVYSRVSRMSYRNGLVEGLFETVKLTKLHQKKQNTKAGGKEGKGPKKKIVSERDPLVSSRSDEHCQSEDASDNCSGDEASSANESMFKDADYGSSEEWSTDQSAVLGALVVHSKKIGDDLLKEKKIKVSKRKRDSPVIWDGEAFLKGKRDSKTIDLGQKGITAKARKTAAA